MHPLKIVTLLASAAAAASLKGNRKTSVDKLRVSEGKRICGEAMTIQCCNKLSTKGFLGLDLFSDFNIFNNCADLDLDIAGFFDGPLGTKCGYN
ncbi:hypothetical protein ACLX1H_005759 [Fusarium chlamydosporum]